MSTTIHINKSRNKNQEAIATALKTKRTAGIGLDLRTVGHLCSLDERMSAPGRQHAVAEP